MSENTMTTPHHPDFPPHLTTPRPIKKVLESLEFAHGTLGVVRRWSGLEFSAFENEFGWTLAREGRVTRREAWPPYDRRVESPIAPVELMAILYEMWAEVFMPADPPDVYLCLGRDWLDYRRQVKSLIPPLPYLWADRAFFRYCLSYIEQRHDWIYADYDVRFSYLPGQLRICARDVEVHCPAGGKWIGEAVVSAKELLRCLPKRFMRRTVKICIERDRLVVANHVVPATWHEPETPADTVVAS